MQLGIRTGYDAMKATGSLLQFGKENLTDLPSQKSRWLEPIPGTKGSDHRTDMSLALASLGQGSNHASPIDINSMTSALATGVWMKPHLVSDKENGAREVNKAINGRDYRIRTCDLCTPSATRYQTAPSPDKDGVIQISQELYDGLGYWQA